MNKLDFPFPVVTWDGGDVVLIDQTVLPDKLAWDAEPKVLPFEDGLYPHAIPGVTEVI